MGFGGFCGFLINYLEVFWFEIYYFYISQTKSSLDKIFYKIVYDHIIYMCDFFGEFKWHFCRSLHGFSRDCGLHHIHCHVSKGFCFPLIKTKQNLCSLGVFTHLLNILIRRSPACSRKNINKLNVYDKKMIRVYA